MIAPEENGAAHSQQVSQRWETTSGYRTLANERADDETAGGFAASASRLMGDHPIIVVVTAVAFGAAAGWLVKRKLHS